MEGQSVPTAIGIRDHRSFMSDHLRMNEPVWSLDEAASRSNVSRATIQRRIIAGEIIGAHKVGRGWRVPMSGLIAAGIEVSEQPKVSAEAERDALATLVIAAEEEARRWQQRAESLERELAARVDHLADLKRVIARLELTTGSAPPAPAPRPKRRWFRRDRAPEPRLLIDEKSPHLGTAEVEIVDPVASESA